MVAANPGEIIPIAHLVFHFGQFAAVILFEIGAAMQPGSRAVPIGAHGDNITNRAVMEAIDGFDVAGLVMTLQADANLQSLFL